MTEQRTPQPSSAFKLAAAQVIDGLQRWLPAQLGVAQVAVSAVVAPKGTGFSNQTFLFAAQGQDFVLQAAPVGKGLFARYDFANMARIQQQLGAVSQVPVAGIVGVETDTQPLGVPFYVMRRVNGRAPTDKPPYHRGSWFTELPAAEHESIWWSGIEAMAQLHALDIDRDGFGFLTETPWGMARAADPASRSKQHCANWNARRRSLRAWQCIGAMPNSVIAWCTMAAYRRCSTGNCADCPRPRRTSPTG
jgi:aminoglycoside phosphotransferase (APT) family kinase protein